MNFQESKEFNELVSKYKLLTLKDKQASIVKLLKENLVIIEKLLNEKNIKSNLLYNKEILDLNSNNYTQDDFAEAVFVYIYSFRELLANYIESVEEKKWKN